MSDLIIFSSTTPVTGMPLLVPGQAQKEFFLNQSLSILDALHPRAVAASRRAPPTAVEESVCYRVTTPAIDTWVGHDDYIAVGIGGDWHFVAPREGMQVFDREAGHWLAYRSGWRSAVAPVMSASGAAIDSEARAALTQLIEVLSNLGILATPTT